MPGLGVEHQYALVGPSDLAECVADAGAFHQGQIGGVRDEELTLGVREVPHQLVPAVRRVGPDNHGTGQGGRLEPEDEFGHVVEHDGDVEGAVVTGGAQPGRPRRGLGHHLGMAETEVVGHQAEAVDIGQARGRHL